MTMALSQQELDSLASMNREQLEELLALIKEAKTLYGHRDGMSLPPSAVAKMTEVVGDQLMKDIVHDLRGGRAEPGFLPAGKSPPPVRGSGWAKPMEHSSPSGLRYIDQAMDVQDRLDKIQLERRLRGDR
jgi:hypothetical protein